MINAEKDESYNSFQGSRCIIIEEQTLRGILFDVLSLLSMTELTIFRVTKCFRRIRCLT